MDIRIGLVWNVLLLKVVVLCQQNYPPSIAPGLATYFTVLENATIGSVIFTLKGVDRDQSKTLIFSTSSPDTQKLVGVGPTVYNNVTRQWDCGVILITYLDRDKSPSSRPLYFGLTDNRGANIVVQILMIISDVNDNPPEFVGLPYRISIKEDHQVGTSVFKVTAEDPDTFLGAVIVYNMTVVSGDDKKFRLDQDSGIITLENHLDYESMSFYHYNVTAKDKGTPPCPGDTCLCNRTQQSNCDPAPTDLFITIIDVQDRPPIFERLPYIATVAEDEPVGFSILHVKAVDGDRGVSTPNNINYTITGGDSSSFEIGETDGIVRVKSALDADSDDVRNRGGLFVFTVTATEVSQNGDALPFNINGTSSTQVSITVTDVNDNAPNFTESSYNASVLENTMRGVPITIDSNIEVIDKDQGINSRFWVFLEKDGAPYNDFDTIPGQNVIIQGRSTITIRVVNSSALDYEQVKTITFQIVARENNSNPNIPTSSEATVTLHIEDANDNSPVFPNQTRLFNVSEASPIGYEVSTVIATDADSGEYGEIVFSLDDDGDESFNISKKGLIQVARELDRETRQSYTLTVVAEDNPNAHEDQRRRSTLRIQISVTDVNDNAPVWTQFIPYVSVLESSPVGTQVTGVKAVDADEGINAEIEYSIVPGTNGSDLFNITMRNDIPQITIKSSLIDHVGLHLVQVMAEDKGTPRLNATLDLSIFVIDENQNSPVFIRPNQSDFDSTVGRLPEIRVDEEQDPNTVLYILSATDKDIGENGLVEYYLDPTTNRDYEYFIVDRINGTLKSLHRLDREQKETYEIQVRASDNGKPAALSTTIMMRVKLNDINDNQPTYKGISMPQDLEVVEENSNAVIGEIHQAKDPDLYPNNVTCYYLYGGDHLSGLHLDKQTRLLSLTEKVDREMIAALNIVIKASENCTLPNNFFISNISSSNVNNSMVAPPAYNSSDDSLLWVKVSVIDINDNPPQFLYHDLSTSAVYDIDVGTVIMSLMDSITDKDTPANRRNKFRLQNITPHLAASDSVDMSKQPFLVSQNGSISTNIRFQSDLLGYFSLQVLAYDDDGLNDTANVKVFLISTFDRLLLVFTKTVNEVEQLKDSFVRRLSDLLQVDLVIDKIQSHVTTDGSRDPSRTDAYLHGRYRTTGKVIPAAELRQLLDFSSAASSYMRSNGVIEAKTLFVESTTDKSEELKKIFAIAASILGVIVIVLFLVLIHMVRLYRRRLRAATTMAISSSSEKQALEHPGTNKYFASENPLFGKDITHIDHDDNDALSHNSLDLNAVDDPFSAPASQPTSPDEEQEVYMQITESNDMFPTKDTSYNTTLDQVLEAYNNEAYDMNSEYNSPPRTNESVRKREVENDLYDDVYDSSLQDLHGYSHIEYTEI